MSPTKMTDDVTIYTVADLLKYRLGSIATAVGLLYLRDRKTNALSITLSGAYIKKNN